MLLLFAGSFLFSQKQKADKHYQELAGRYGGNDGICFFEYGKYMLYGYATALFGTYSFEKDYINFHPDKQELFMIFGSQNPVIGNSSRMYFSGFQDGSTLIQFDESKPQPVFNENANCFSAPYVFMTKTKPSQVILSAFINDAWNQSKFTIPKEYNDLAIVYNEPSRYEENFSGMIKSEGKTKVLTISMFDRGLKKSNEDQNDTNWREILEMKAKYEQSKEINKTGIFFNQHYHNFPMEDKSAYNFDKKTNQFISKNAGENEDYFRDNQYNDDRYLRQYLKVEGQTNIDKNFDKNNISAKSIFFTTCEEGSEKSYKYNGFIEYEKKDEPEEMIQTTASLLPNSK